MILDFLVLDFKKHEFLNKMRPHFFITKEIIKNHNNILGWFKYIKPFINSKESKTFLRTRRTNNYYTHIFNSFNKKRTPGYDSTHLVVSCRVATKRKIFDAWKSRKELKSQ